MIEPLPLVALRHVNVHLAGHHALHDVSWELRRGEHWAFTGPNGSGKSTLLRVIRGEQWIDPDGGERRYAFDGRTLAGTIAARRQIAYVGPEQHEHYQRLDLGIVGRDIVASGFDDTTYRHRPLAPDEEGRLATLLDELALAPFAEIATNALSFGQLRRMLVARALVSQPRILVLDEFTNGLDAEARRELLALLEGIAATVTLVVASHRRSDFFDGITHHLQLRAGRIAAIHPGPPPRRRPRIGAVHEVAAAPADDTLVAVTGATIYRGEHVVFRDLAFALRGGEHTAIVGPNGSGKSTLAGLIAGTIHPVHGAEIRRFGKRGPFDIWALKARVAHVSDEWQTLYQASDTVADVVLSAFMSSVGLWHAPSEEQRGAADAILRRLELEALRDRRFMRLSFGERRKVLIARALVRPPELLILDEIWNGLDAEFRALLGTQLAELAAAGTTLVIVAHHDDDLPPLIVRRLRIDDGVLSPAP